MYWLGQYKKSQSASKFNADQVANLMSCLQFLILTAFESRCEHKAKYLIHLEGNHQKDIEV